MLSYLFKQKLVFLFLAFWAFVLGIMPNLGQAGLVESKTGMAEQYETDLAKVKMFLEQEIVQKQLERTGINKEELLKRIEKLDAEQLRELAMRCDRIKVGGSAGGVLLIIAIVFLVIIAIFYFTNYVIKIERRDAIPRRY